MIEWYKNWYIDPPVWDFYEFPMSVKFSIKDGILQSTESGCISSFICKTCGINCVCESSGRAGTFNKDKTIRYIWGPCCCTMTKCPECYEKFVSGE